MPALLEPTDRTVPVPWNADNDPDQPCPVESCGHPYERHFDSYGSYHPWDDGDDDHPAVGCKYCKCGAFAGIRIPQPPKARTVGHLLTIIDPFGPVVTVHATEHGANTFLTQTVAERWQSVMADTPPPLDSAASVAQFFDTGRPDHSFRLEPVVIQT